MSKIFAPTQAKKSVVKVTESRLMPEEYITRSFFKPKENLCNFHSCSRKYINFQSFIINLWLFSSLHKALLMIMVKYHILYYIK